MVDATIIVHTYNHAPYISLCFRSILEQATSRRLQIVWHDDASTDDTVSLGERALLHCPYEIVRIHQKTNRVSRRIPFLLDIFEQCRGEYIFLIDGDDCWALTDKIDLQIDALISHPDQKVCFTPAIEASGVDLTVQGVLGQHLDTLGVITLDRVIRGNGGFMPTPSLCFRRQVFETAPGWLFGYICCGDYPLQVLASSPAGAVYLPELTCVSRTNIEGSWTTEVLRKPARRVTFEVEFLELLFNIHQSVPGHKDAIMSVALPVLSDLLAYSINKNDFISIEKALLTLKEIR